jgi:hypothetical protein
MDAEDCHDATSTTQSIIELCDEDPLARAID